jgi:hypothetical protein
MTLATLCGYSQSSQSVVTIIGDAPEITTNTTEVKTPEPTQQLTAQNTNIEPTLENGFHMRFELYSEEKNDLDGLGGHSPENITFFGRSKKHAASMTERTFNVKKRLNYWLPERKKKYHPHLCGRF